MSHRNRLKVVTTALLALAVSALGTACNPECVDKYDCLAAATTAGVFTCERSRCVKQAPGEVDAGSP
jgi:hypothetical protein